jgi:hypothetical protein
MRQVVSDSYLVVLPSGLTTSCILGSVKLNLAPISQGLDGSVRHFSQDRIVYINMAEAA